MVQALQKYTLIPMTIRDIRAARRRIASGIALTPCPESIPLSEGARKDYGLRVYCKLENFQRTGSFKERGARNALLQLSLGQRKLGVIAASAGNHALGLAYHGNLLGIPVTVVMPDYAPLIKITTCQRLGARVIVNGIDFPAARAEADRIARLESLAYIHGFDDPAIIAGQGTIGLEIMEQVPEVDAIICPVGGAGLIAGVSLAVKALRPSVRIIGVESAATGNFSAAWRSGKSVPVRRRSTLADGLATLAVGTNAFAIARRQVDEIIRVKEKWIALAILRMLELEKTVVEGAAAVPLAALMSGQLDTSLRRLGRRRPSRPLRIVLIVGGGNIDPSVLGRVIEKGLVHDGRLSEFTARISDRPGGLAELCRVIAATGASIKDVSHDRAFSGPDVSAVQARCTVETRDRAHIKALHAALRRAGFELGV